MVNVVAFYTGPHVALARDVVRTLRSVFGHVRCLMSAYLVYYRALDGSA